MTHVRHTPQKEEGRVRIFIALYFEAQSFFVIPCHSDELQMRPCSNCHTKTIYRENTANGKYFCDPLCQQIALQKLSGKESSEMVVETKKERDWEERPEFIGDELWKTLSVFVTLSGKTRSNRGPLLESITRRLCNQIDELLVDTEKKLQFLILEAERYKHKKNLKLVKNESERDSILTKMAILTLKITDLGYELENSSWLEWDDPMDEKLQEYSHKLTIIQSLIGDLIRDFTLFASEQQQHINQNNPGTAVVVEEMIPERVEVSTGMTQQQQDLFDHLEQLIDEADAKSKICDSVVASYVKKCDVVMHLPLFRFLVTVVSKRDPYLRNVFETGTSVGSELHDMESRLLEEHQLFLSKEYDLFDAHDKVKYATINWAHSRDGCIQVSHEFGKSYLIFTPEVKERCTYARYDSVNTNRTKPEYLGTQQSKMCHISKEFMRREIQSMYDYIEKGSHGENKPMNSVEEYMEVQIHGELLFSRDVSRIMIGSYSSEKKYLEPLLREYFKIIGKVIPYEFI